MKKLYTFLILVGCCVQAYPQHQAASFTFNQPLSGGGHHYQARDFIDMEPGFEYEAITPGEEFVAEINPFLLFPPTAGITGGPNPGDNGVVGVLPAVVNITDLGAATYSIPLNLPPGIGNMTPQIAITYNSNTGNGLLGWGWTISGLSAINRTGSTIYHDNKVRGIKFDDEDNFMLDGNRLISLTSTEFKTEIESFSKIVKMQSNSYGPLWFEVRTKDGRIMQYGNTTDSKHKLQGKQEVLAWYLNRVEDYKGNHIDFEYSQYNGELRLFKIKYGGNRKTGQSHIYEIQLHVWGGRKDPNEVFISGGSMKMDQILADITVKHIATDTFIYTYSFEYDWMGFYTRLSNLCLIEGHGNGNKLNSTSFIWQSNTNNVVIENVQKLIYNYSQSKFFLDMNGDGQSDYIELAYTNNNGKFTYHDWWIRKRIGNSFTTINLPLQVNSLFYSLLVGDFNGDGNQDFITIKYTNKNRKHLIIDYMFLSNGNEYTAQYINNLTINVGESEYIIGDFTGNGKDELAIVMKSIFDNKIRLFSLENGLTLISDTPLTFSNAFYVPVIQGDFNGNGKINLLVRENVVGFTYTCIYEYNYVSKQFDAISISSSFLTKDHRILMGDFNGDGIADILSIPKIGIQNREWKVHTFNGLNSWVSIQTPYIPPFDPEDKSESILKGINVSDYNGDGKSDIIYISKTNYNDTTATVKIYYSSGIKFSNPQLEVLAWIGDIDLYGVVYNQKFKHFHMDFNGDGKSDLFRSYSVNYDAIYYFSSQNNPDQISTISDGHGVNISFTYKPLTDNNVYAKGNTAVFPIQDIQSPIYVVYEFEQEINGQHTNKKRYYYESAKVHKQGRGFLGFGKITINDLTNEIKTINEYYMCPIYYYTNLGISTTYTTRHFPNKRLSKTSNILNYKTYKHPKIFFPYDSVIYTLNWDNDINNNELFIRTSKQLTNYDDYGNPVSIIQLMHPEYLWIDSPHENYDHRTITEISYYPTDLSNWLIGQTKNKTITQAYRNEPEIISMESYKYYQTGETHFPLLKELLNFSSNNENDELALKTTFDYDDYGNTIKSKLSTLNWTPELEKISEIYFSSDYQFRFPTNFTDPSGHESKSSYDEIYGWKSSNTDQNNLTTFYEQVFFQYNSLKTNPDGKKQVNVLRWAANHEDAPLQALYYSWNKTSGIPEEIVFYNKTGHELRTVNIGFDGCKIYQDKEYNNLGLLKKISLPYFPGEQIYYTSFEYDALGRVIKTTYPDETTSTTHYHGNSNETTNQLQQTTKQIYNAAGWLIESEDANGGKVNYEYFSDGNLKTTWIVNQLQTTVNIQYNSRGQRCMLEDPNYGTAIYKYNPFGELVEQVSSNNDTTTYVYDILGRMITQTEPESITQWIYDETPGRIGTLQSAHNNLHQTSYAYDDLLRLTLATETIEGNNYQTSYTYDVLGRVNTTTHPSGFVVKNAYNQYGYHTQIRTAQNTSLIWQSNDVNAVGMITGFRTGNELLTSYEFETVTQRLTNIYTRKNSQNPIQSLDYFWNEIGNLKQRKNNIHNLVEFFTYDELNRIKTIKLNGIILGEHQYDPSGLGNLIYKKSDGQILLSDAAYGQNNTGPHALTSATTTIDVFPTYQQIISYNSYDKAVSIIEDTKQLQITYGHHHQRISQQYTDGVNTIEKVWAGACEYITKNGQQYIHTYLSGPLGLFAIHIIKPDGTEEINYIHTDHLGSWNTITDESGNLLQELSFDAWGNRRDPATWRSFAGTAPEPLFDRGFTGHEHLYAFNLINMNGRMYDPIIGRMLSPDNYIQAPDFSQSFNRYSYAWNNPLVFTDPDGEFIFTALLPGVGVFLDAACWGAVIGGAGYTASVAFSDGGFNNWDWGQFGKSVGVGAISGVATAGIGQAFGAVGSMGIGGEIARAYTHGFANGMISQFTGGDFMQGFASGALGSLAGSAFMMYGGSFANSPIGTYAFSGLAGGVGAELTGGNFWQGAAIGLMNAGLNHLQQGITNYLDVRFNGDKVSVYDTRNGKTIYETDATSGKGEHMNNPASQHLVGEGPIPEGSYSYKNTNWKSQSKLRQVYNILAGNGDWGDYNVPLDVVKNNSTRSNFYLHGGFFRGSAGCIDVGANIGKIYNLTKLQRVTNVYVNY